MKHGLNFGRDLAGYLLVVTVAADHLFTLFPAEMTHIWTAAENLTRPGNLESFHDDLSRLLLLFGHCGYFFGLTWAIKSLPKNFGAWTSVETSDSRLIT